jgi:hypothetical protein
MNAFNIKALPWIFLTESIAWTFSFVFSTFRAWGTALKSRKGLLYSSPSPIQKPQEKRKELISMKRTHKALGHGLYHNWALDLGWALIPIKPAVMGFTLTKMKELIKTKKHYVYIYIY